MYQALIAIHKTPKLAQRLCILGLFVGLGAPVFLEWVRQMGHNIPQMYIQWDYAVALTWALILAGVIALLPLPREEKPYVLLLWVLKVCVALGFMLLYENKYGLDAYFYFFYHAGGAPDMQQYGGGSARMLQIVHAHQSIFPNSFHGLKVSFAFTGLWACYLFYKGAERFLDVKDIRIFMLISLTPSVMFWSTTLSKDTIILTGLALHFWGLAAFSKKQDLWSALVIFGGLWLAASIRFWLLPTLVLPMLMFFWRHVQHRPLERTILAVLSAVILSYAVLRLKNVFNITSFSSLILRIEYLSQMMDENGKAIELIDSRGPLGLLRSFPLGFFTALFRPLPGEIMHAFGLMAGVENLALLVLAIRGFHRSYLAQFKNLRHPFALWSLAYILLWATLYSFISHQNLGAAVRFKLQILPPFIFLLLYLNFFDRLRQPDMGRTI